MSKIVSMADFKLARRRFVAMAGAAPAASVQAQGATQATIASPGPSTDRLPR